MNNRNNTSFNEILNKINNLNLEELSFFSDLKDNSSLTNISQQETMTKLKKDMREIALAFSNELIFHPEYTDSSQGIEKIANLVALDIDTDPKKWLSMIEKFGLMAICLARMEKVREDKTNIEIIDRMQLLINAIHHKRKQLEESKLDKNLLAIESFSEKGIKKLVEQITCMISALPEIYQQLKKTGYHQDTHLDDVNSLAEASIKMVTAYRNRNTRNVEKFRQLIELLQGQLDHKTTALSLHSLFGMALVDKLNASPNEHHYTRLIAYVLNSIVQDMASTLYALKIKIRHSALEGINMPDQYHALFKKELPLAHKKFFNHELNEKNQDSLVLPTCFISLKK